MLMESTASFLAVTIPWAAASINPIRVTPGAALCGSPIRSYGFLHTFENPWRSGASLALRDIDFPQGVSHLSSRVGIRIHFQG